MISRNSLGRPPAQQGQVLSSLRAEIVSGRLAPGEQLPTRLDMVDQYGVCMATVQSALDSLRRDGFIRVQGRGGTFVSKTPPHLTRFAVVFGPAPSRSDWSHYYAALQQEAEALQQTTAWQLPLYFGVDGHEDSEDYQRLVRDVRARRVGGLIFANAPFLLANTPLLEEPDLPRVTIASQSGPGNPYPTVAHDSDSFKKKALRWLKDRGCKRVAFLATWDAGEFERLEAEVAKYGMATRRHWWQLSHAQLPASARQAMHLLFHEDHRERPDALVIWDDNLVEHALGGLMAAGVRFPKDVQIVAHSNFSWLASGGMPVKRLGYDMRELLRICIGGIEAQIRGENPEPLARIEAIFDDEMAERRGNEFQSRTGD